ncbi:MAG: 4Fe-4S binding protein [Thermodesulfobacteriota bacterium]
MSQEVYKHLLQVMQKRGGGYAGMDIPEFYALVEELFTPLEAEVNNTMPKGPFTAKDLAGAMGKDEGDIRPVLEAMADKGLCLAITTDQGKIYQSARFMPGIFEFQFMPGKTSERDKRIAGLIYAYKKAFDRQTKPSPAAFPSVRVITVDAVIKIGNQVHTYDQVQSFIDSHSPIAVSTCYCRHAADLRGEDTHGLPNDVCMQFGLWAQFAVERLGARLVTKEEAREVLTRAEEAGLIHMSQNMTEGISFICNCDRWHCFAVQDALAKPKPGLFFNSGFEPVFDPDLCTACGICIDRCPPQALTLGEGDVPVVDLDRCFGCAACATGCPTAAIAMVNKPGFSAPPKDAKALREAFKTALA